MKKSLKRNNHSLSRILLIMKLFVLFITVCTLQISASVYSQTAKLTVEAKNATFGEVFDQIENQSEYVFFYRNGSLDNSRKVNVNAKNKSLENILEEVFANTDISYSVRDRLVILGNKEVLQQEKKTISGIVSDQYGDPLPGATVIVKGTNAATTTSVEGLFTLPFVDNKDVLVISCLGYLKKEVKVGAQKDLIVQMEEDLHMLDEVVVVGFGVQKKVNLSGAVGTVSSEILANRPIPNISTALQGTIANLNITNSSGRATETSSINIRGYGSLNGGEPLILVDNVPISSSELSRLNPDDIENISILKDAASSAIYGARAAFGVLLITTKTGKSAKLKVSANTNYSVRKITRVPEVITDPYTTVSYKDIMSKPWYNDYSEADYDYARRRSEDPSLPAVILNPVDQTKWKYFGTTNWFEELYTGESPSFTQNVSLSQRTDKLDYYISAEYFRQDGMLRYGNDIYNRYNLRSKANLNATNWLDLGANITYTYSTYDEPTNGGWLLFHNANRTPSLNVPKNPDGSWTQSGASLLGQLQNGGRWDTHTNDIQASFIADVKIIKDVLNLKGDATMRMSNKPINAFTLPYTYKQGPDLAPNTSGQSSASHYDTYTRYNVYNAYADFKKTFNKKHFLQALAGFNQEYWKQQYNSTTRAELISYNLPTLQLSTGDITASETIRDYALRSMFYRLNYIYDSKYIIEFNGRYDGTSSFPKNDRFGTFPSVSGSWVVSQEKFFQPVSKIADMLKLRASYGSLGNQIVMDGGSRLYYPYIPSMTSGKISTILNGKQPMAVYNPPLVSGNLTWEKISTVNFGIDAAFLKNRLTVSYDNYTRYVKDMLTSGQPLPAVLGANVPKENAADLKTQGWELTIGWNDVSTVASKPFRYSASMKLWDSRAYITKFDNPTRTLDSYYVGQELGEIWGFQTAGFYKDADDVKNSPDQSKVMSYVGTRPIEAGDIKFVNRNGDDKIYWGNWTVDDPGDAYVIGNSRARYSFGFELNGEWNGIDLRAFAQGVGKRDWYPAAGNHYFWGVFAQPWSNVLKSNLDHWTPENPNAYFPRLKSYTAESSWSELGCPQTKYLQNAAYMRLKNLTVGYTLPRSLTSKWKIDKLRFYFSGENLFEITKLSRNLDPENLDGTNYPFQRTYSLGLNLNF